MIKRFAHYPLEMPLFDVARALAVGHVMGGPDPHQSAVLALSNAYRHTAIAISIASTNFRDEQFGATVLLYAS